VQIVDLQLERVRQLAEAAGVELEVTDDAKKVLAQEGFEPAFGARPLRRVIQRMIQDPLALLLLEQGGDAAAQARVDVGADGRQFEIELLAAEEEAVLDGA
jgi:ATP-dependent Clp protease ATP-binding subunit ClpB